MFVPGDRRPKGSSSEAFLGKSGGIEAHAKRELVDTQQQLIENTFLVALTGETCEVRMANHILISFQPDHPSTLQVEIKLDVGSNGPPPLKHPTSVRIADSISAEVSCLSRHGRSRTTFSGDPYRVCVLWEGD